MIHRPRALAALAAALLLVPLVAAERPADKPKINEGFSAAVYLEHVKFLASDELGGRGTGTPGLEKAADYVAERLRQAGCKPAGDDGTFFQSFEVSDGKQINEKTAKLEIDGMGAAPRMGKDWRAMPFSADGEASGPLALAGYGIKAPDFDYDDFADFDAKGKVLLVLRGEPRSQDDTAEFGGKDRSRHALFVTKARVAHEAGAAALLVVDPRTEAGELYPFNRQEMGRGYELPIVSITRELADKLLKKAGMDDVAALEKKLEADRKPASTDMKDLTVKLNPGLEPKMLKTANVVGLLPGDGSSDEIIAVGAHYDHLGTSGEGESKQINNGADDNASGTAGVMELARVLGTEPKLRRNILFMTFSGEERGLLGSRHFVDHPTIDLTKVKAMFNMDMIGRLAQNKFEMWGADTADEFPDLVQKAAEAAGIEYTAPARTGGIFGRSDHASFYRKDIPVLFPFTGLHQQYHHPDDDWNLVDPDGAVKVLQMAEIIIGELARMENGPTLATRKPPRSEGEAGGERGEQAGKPAGDDAGPRMPRVRMGVMPSYADDGKPGMLVDGVMDGQPAEKAGIKTNDRIIQIGGKKIVDVTSYMAALGEAKPGDEIDVVVLRDGQEMTFKVKLAAPRGPGEPR